MNKNWSLKVMTKTTHQYCDEKIGKNGTRLLQISVKVLFLSSDRGVVRLWGKMSVNIIMIIIFDCFSLFV